MIINRRRLYALSSLTWALFVSLSWYRIGAGGLLNVSGFVSLVTLPGLAPALSLKTKEPLPHWYRLSLIIGFSLLEILLATLFFNTLLPHLHVPRPLDPKPLLAELSSLYIASLAICWKSLKNFRYRINARGHFKSRADIGMLLAPLLFVALAVTGAISLNNGGSDVLTMIMLLGITVYIGCLLALRHRLGDNTLSWGIYMMSLSLLLMTSLRGWYITGHDIQHEFEVFQLTKAHGLWSIAHFHDPYNSCLSITILPTILANLLHVPDPYVFKVFFQLIFATVPVVIYLLMRRYLSSAKSLLAVVYFIAFPTFFTDMPFLNRQEIAFLFLALMILVIYDRRLELYKRTWLFIGFGLGMIVSHYSTTYSWLFILLLAALLRPIYNYLVLWVGGWHRFRQANIINFQRKSRPTITVAMVVMLVYLCFIWNTVLTGTSDAVTGVVGATVSSIMGGLRDDVHSSDVSYSLFSPASLTPAKELASYNSQVVEPERKSQPAGNTYPEVADGPNLPQALELGASPLTGLGRLISHTGLNVSFFNYILKQATAKLLQIFVVIGLVYTLFRRRLSRPIESEYLLLTVASLVFVLLQVGLPYLSEAYGLLRAFQQSLMLLGLFLVVGTFALTAWSPRRLIRLGMPVLIALLFFLTSTGVVSQLLGGYQAQLHLNNSGQYYDIYYTHAQEISAAGWLNRTTAAQPGGAAGAVVQADNFTFSKLDSYTQVRPVTDIYPSMITRNSYVFLGYFNVTAHQSAIFYDGDTVFYSYPVQLLGQEKNLVYSNGGAEIYR